MAATPRPAEPAAELPLLAEAQAAAQRADDWNLHNGRNTWLNPYDEKNHDLLITLAREAQSLGFDEIQLDYIRFPVDEGTKFAMFPGEGEKPRREALLAPRRSAVRDRAAVTASCFWHPGSNYGIVREGMAGATGEIPFRIDERRSARERGMNREQVASGPSLDAASERRTSAEPHDCRARRLDRGLPFELSLAVPQHP